MTLQRQYLRHLPIGFVGNVSRPTEPWNLKRGQTSVAVSPGDGVIYDSGTSRYRLPTTDAERKLIEGIVSFNPTDFNVDVASPTENNNTRVTFPIGTVIKVITFGSVYVRAGATVAEGDGAIYNQATNRWIEYDPSAGTLDDYRDVPMEFIRAGADGEVVEVRIHSKVRF